MVYPAEEQVTYTQLQIPNHSLYCHFRRQQDKNVKAKKQEGPSKLSYP